MPAWPTGPIDYGSFAWLRREIAPVLGLPHDVRLLDHVDRSRVDSVIESGLRLFYYPNPSQFTVADATEAQKERLKRAPHQWSFLQKTATLSIVIGTAVYDLPADFSNFLDEPITADGRVAIVTAAHLRQLLASASSSGHPKYIAVEAKSHDGSSSQRSEAILFPVPDANTTISIRYGISATGLSDTIQFPHGGQEHAETILACCRMVAADRTGGVTESAQMQYAERMAASVLMDAHVAQHSSEGVWPVDEPENGLEINRQYLGRLIGRELGYGPNRYTWTFQQAEMVKECLKQGLRRFYSPPVVPGERYPYSWSFLQPIGTMTTVIGEEVVQFPAGFTMLDGDMTYRDEQSVGLPYVRQVGEEMVRKNHARMESLTGHPQLVAVRASNAGGAGPNQYEAIFWPTPSAVYVFEYRYRIDPVMLVVSGDGSVPGGGQAHHQTLIESCLLACDEMMKRDSRQRAEKFRELLFASVGFDRQLSTAPNLGYNGDSSDRNQIRDYRQLDSYVTIYGGGP